MSHGGVRDSRPRPTKPLDFWAGHLTKYQLVDGKVVPIIRPDDYPAVERRVRKLWDEGETRFVWHATGRKAQREITNLDVQAVLKTGRIIRYEMGKQHWRYDFEGRDTDGRLLRIGVEVNGMVIIVTVINLSRRKV